eukprot:scaffold235247_cov14-Prasinocladus_malaysianus.AAC.1
MVITPVCSLYELSPARLLSLDPIDPGRQPRYKVIHHEHGPLRAGLLDHIHRQAYVGIAALVNSSLGQIVRISVALNGFARLMPE